MRNEFLRMLYEKHFETVYKYLLPKLGFDKDAAADCAHEVFDEAGEQYEKLKVHPNILGWLMTTAKHRLHKAWRKNARMAARSVPLELASAVPDTRDPYDAVELSDADVAEAADAVLSVLGENELAIYKLFYVRGLSFAETAQALGITEKAARARLARVKAKLKNRIADMI